MFKKTLQNNKPLREPKNSIPTAVPHPHHKVSRPKELWSERRGSNSRHPPWEGGALPSELRSPNRPYLMEKPKKRQQRFFTFSIRISIPLCPNAPKNMPSKTQSKDPTERLQRVRFSEAFVFPKNEENRPQKVHRFPCRRVRFVAVDA